MDVGSLLMKIGIKVDGKELEALQSSIAKTASGFDKLAAINSKLNVIMGVAALKSVKDFVGSMGAESMELLNMAAATNVSVESFQKLKFAVGQAGSNIGELAPALTHLNRLIQDARLGGDDAIQTFYRLGISQQQISSFHGAEDALYAVMDALGKIKDPIKRQVMLEKALGGMGLARFALAGSQAAKASKVLAKRMGAVVSPQATAQYAQARIALSQFGVVVGGVGANLLREFAPSITTVVQGIEEFYLSNKKVIDSTIHEWVVKMIWLLADLYVGFYVAARAVAHFVADHPKLIGLLESSGIAILQLGAGLFAAKKGFELLLGVRKAVLGFIALLGSETFFVTAQWTALAAAVVAGMLALYSGWQMLHGTSFQDTAIAKSLGAIKNMALGAKDALAGVTGEMFPGLLTAFQTRGYAPGETQFGPPSRTQTWRDLLVPGTTPFAPAPAIMMPAFGGPQDPGGMLNANTTNNVTVNVANGMSADAAQEMVTNALRDSQTQAHQLAINRLNKPHKG